MHALISNNTGGDGVRIRSVAGNGVLSYDLDNTGAFTEMRQYVFTEWDPTATRDMEALRAVFDSNGDGVEAKIIPLECSSQIENVRP